MYLEDGDFAFSRNIANDVPDHSEFHEVYFLVGCKFGEITTFRGNSLHSQKIGEEISQPKQASDLCFIVTTVR